MDEMPAPVLDAGRRRQGRLAVGDRPRRSRMERVKGGSGNGDGLPPRYPCHKRRTSPGNPRKHPTGSEGLFALSNALPRLCRSAAKVAMTQQAGYKGWCSLEATHWVQRVGTGADVAQLWMP